LAIGNGDGRNLLARFKEAPVRQKLGMILEKKVVQKLKLEKIFFLQKMIS
jgi:hypothetical protein